MTDKESPWIKWCEKVGTHLVKESTIEFPSFDRQYLNSVTYSTISGPDGKPTVACTSDVWMPLEK